MKRREPYIRATGAPLTGHRIGWRECPRRRGLSRYPEHKAKPPPPIIDLPITDLWFSYYKDLRGHQRADGSPGRLKMGYGPGGPPVIGVPQLLALLQHVLRLKMVKDSDVAALLTKQP
jgi:hypothetical protein